MAEDHVVDGVMRDYSAAQDWLADILFEGYGRFLRESPAYLSGDYLQRQRRIIVARVQQRAPRLIAVVRAHHDLQVRQFSDDGLSCILIDTQTEQRIATYDYAEHRRLYTQAVGDRTYVYRMAFDPAAGHWKIDEFIQQLPLGWSPYRLEESLPLTSGRDI
ncbi:MAG TPA: hypothetical protein VMT34_06530 [Aggregatilineales bacterium]|nr:hypothetical protein [Aggregatilineales bacterium]